MIAALGAWERLIAVSHECDALPDPLMPARVTRSAIDASAGSATIDQEVRAALSSGAALFTLDGETIRALAPDLIITQGVCDVCAVSVGQVLEIASLISPTPRILSLGATRLDDVIASVSEVASALGISDEGLELVAGMRVRLRTIHERLKRENAPRPRVAFIEWTDPPFVAGHWVPDMIRRAGGIDVMAEPGAHSRRVSAAELQSANPDVVIVAGCGYSLARSANDGMELLARPEFAWMRERAVWSMDGNALTSRPGPRLCIGVEVLSHILHPALFGTPHEALALPLTSR